MEFRLVLTATVDQIGRFILEGFQVFRLFKVFRRAIFISILEELQQVIDVSSFDEKRTKQERQPTHRVKSLNKHQKDELKQTKRRKKVELKQTEKDDLKRTERLKEKLKRTERVKC